MTKKQLLELLDNVTAIAETLMVHNKTMSHDDRAARERVIEEARMAVTTKGA